MAKQVKYTKPEEYYEELCGEIFKGKVEGLLCIEEKEWLKIKIVKMSESMEEGLENIEDKFNGKIWKGFKDDYLYVECDDDLEEGTKTNFEIVDYGKFTSKEWRKVEEYSEECGYYFILEEK